MFKDVSLPSWFELGAIAAGSICAVYATCKLADWQVTANAAVSTPSHSHVVLTLTLSCRWSGKKERHKKRHKKREEGLTWYVLEAIASGWLLKMLASAP